MHSVLQASLVPSLQVQGLAWVPQLQLALQN
jgi:hypothetical protein